MISKFLITFLIPTPVKQHTDDIRGNSKQYRKATDHNYFSAVLAGMFYKTAFVYVFVDASANSSILTENDHAHLLFHYIHQTINYIAGTVDQPPQPPGNIGRL